MDKLIPAFETTLFDPTLSDACLDIAELGIDSLLDEGLFKSIPVVSLLVGVGKTAQNVHDRNLLKQTIKFINTFNQRSISQEKINKYRIKLESQPKYAEEELGRVIIYLNSTVDLKKSELLGKFYHAYVEEIINWDTFCEMSDITSRLFIADLQLLYDIYHLQITDTTQCPIYKADRLIALGLLDSATKSVIVSSSTGSQTQRYIQVNELGKLFCELSLS